MYMSDFFNILFSGTLFADDFLRQTVVHSDAYRALDDAALDATESAFRKIFDRFPTDQMPNESQTEDDLIWPILRLLGWTEHLRQQNLAPRGRSHVPDGLLFADDETKDCANTCQESQRYAFGLAIVESKRWHETLDRGAKNDGERIAPSTQMLRYLRRVDDLTQGKLRWGILTNGAKWRLYDQGARSVSEQFFEIDLAALFDLHSQSDFTPSDDERRHHLKLFVLFFRRESFVGDPTFHQYALDEGRFYEERVANNLSGLVFDDIFPQLVRAIVQAAPDAPLPHVRDAALTLLYRLLFILYAEDRDLLPVRDRRYDDYSLRKVRDDVRARKERGDTFSGTAARYYHAIDDLCRVIDKGDSSIGLPPYNGGLFDRERTPLLSTIRLGDQVVADVIDALSFEKTPEGRRYINYRSLSVEQLGSIYERLLEHEVIRDGDGVVIRPNIFARKESGSYYTPDGLVRLIIEKTVGPLVQDRMDAFASKVAELKRSRRAKRVKIAELKRVDPAVNLLDLKICDPAMGSGPFLVGLVDHLADRVIAAMAEDAIAGYVSPLTERVDAIRDTIMENAEMNGWAIDAEKLDDRHIIRRMVLKRCVYGVDKNPMVVELAKVSLWLHTFTAGAPLSFLDHHLRCGDSLIGLRVKEATDELSRLGGLFAASAIAGAEAATESMQRIEDMSDADVAEVRKSASLFGQVEETTADLRGLLDFLGGLRYLTAGMKKREHATYEGPLVTTLGRQPDNAYALLSRGPDHTGDRASDIGDAAWLSFSELWREAKTLAQREHFLHWEVAFPGVWRHWQNQRPQGGFDAVIGNPPWDRIKLQEVEWFANRAPELARAPTAAARRAAIQKRRNQGDPIAAAFDAAKERADKLGSLVRASGHYPLLGGGDINLYSLFVERAMSLLKPDGLIGLLTPSGIYADKTAARFFKSVSTAGHVACVFDFENKKIFFPDVHASFKFCALVFGGEKRAFAETHCAFFLHDIATVDDPQRRFPLTPDDFARFNPNTGTAPVFRNRRDADITRHIYEHHPVLVDRSGDKEYRVWPVRYNRMFDMTNDSGLFRTREELEEREGAYPIGGNRFNSPSGEWFPLYEGKMVQAYDHRAASIVVNPENRHRPAQSQQATLEQHKNPDWLPEPRFWVSTDSCKWPKGLEWIVSFKHVTAPTNVRTMIASILPRAGFGNSLPILLPIAEDRDAVQAYKEGAYLLTANLNAFAFDFVTRQKVQGQNLNWFIVEQLPVVPPDRFASVRFGPKTAGDIVREAVLELTYTAHDMAPFARDLGYVDESGDALPPFVWNADRRLRLRARLDAVFFHLYGVMDRDDVRYVYSTFPIVERQETAAYGTYRSRDLCLAYMNALAAGDADADPVV